jgi:hypothetical protein
MRSMSRSAAAVPVARRWRGVAGGAAGAALLGAAMAWLWGFTVDDALVTCRVAQHLHQGLGYRFNTSGPVVDAVTPLGFAHLLAPFAAAGPLAALHASKWLGGAAVVLASYVLGRRVLLRTSSAYGAGLLLALALTSPLAAWAVSGMETGLVTALAVGALGGGKGFADGCALLAAAWRPELLPWCVSIRFGLRVAEGAPLGRAAASAGLAACGALAVAVVRLIVFGRAAPLSAFAKPSDLAHGASYALHAFVQTGLPLLCVAPLALRRGAPVARAVAIAGALHFLALALAGGDWMSLYRLAVPVLPSFVLGAAELSRVAAGWASWLRLTLALAMSAYLSLSVGSQGRNVMRDRERLIEEAREPLRGARVVAALDVGWLGAATDATIVDLAGITDESIAMLPGGHTSKRIDDSILRSREVDALVLLQSSYESEYQREVERRVALLPTFEQFRRVSAHRLDERQRSAYVVFRRP